MDASDGSGSAARGSAGSQLSREIVQLHARLYGRGPTKARSHVQREYAVCILEEIFTFGEKTLIENGSADHVRETRKKFEEAVGDEFISIVERATGRRVRSFLSQVDVETNVALEFFLFEDTEPDASQ